MTTRPKFCDSRQAAELMRTLGAEFAIVANPTYIHPPFEIYPLAPKATPPYGRLLGVVCDMDGTTTTTEPLCLHSLEYMVRRMSGRPEPADWPGLSQERDYPHVIGNSTTRHVEYLVQTYAGAIKADAYFDSLVESLLWTCHAGKDDGRRLEAMTTAKVLDLAPLLGGRAAGHFAQQGNRTLGEFARYGRAAAAGRRAKFRLPAAHDLVRGAIEIYYARYHQILEAISRGEGPDLAQTILGGAGMLIEPMPGAALFLATIKGLWSPSEAGVLYDALAPRLLTVLHGRRGAREVNAADLAAGRTGFLRAAARFAQAPLKVAIVTSSIRYEAEIVLKEVFRGIGEEIARWPIPKTRRDRLRHAMRSPDAYYDAILTASDSSEIRLKPHRDLYSIALHRLGLSPDDFDAVLGLEDSESGLIAIRGAGIGLAVAVPFAQTRGHDLAAAAKINHGGLPELMFEDHFCLALA